MKKTLRWRIAQTFEARWWKKYLSHKDVATYLEWKRGYWNNVLNLLKDSIKLKPGQKILDAGNLALCLDPVMVGHGFLFF